MDDKPLSEIRERAEASAGPCKVSIVGTRDYIVGPHGRSIFEELDADMESLVFHATARETVIALCDEIDRLRVVDAKPF